MVRNAARHLRPEDLRGKRARGLIRESTARQAEQWSPERQRSDLERAAAELGLVGMDKWYVRVGSGEAEGVVELEEALADGRAGQYDVLLVIHTSRFARNRAEATRMKAEFRKAGIIIYFTGQRLISGSYAATLSEGVSEVIDEHENEQRRYWIAGGMRERQMAGLWVGSLPYGYRRHLADRPDGTRGWDGTLEEDPETGPVVRRMFAMAAEGMSTRQVAQALNIENRRSQHGLPWSGTSVRIVLRNQIYVGRYIRYRLASGAHYYAEDDEHDGRREVGIVPTIVAPEVWRAVNDLFDAMKNRSGRRRHFYPLSGIVRCGLCERPLHGVANARGTRYYRCVGRVQLGLCDAPTRRADVIEASFAAWLGAARLEPDWRTRLAKMREEEPAAPNGAAQRIEQRLARIRDIYTWGDMTEAEYLRERDALRRELGQVRAPASSSVEEVAAALSDLSALWSAGADQPAAKVVASRVLVKALVHPNRVEFVVRSELEPLLKPCVAEDSKVQTTYLGYTVRFSG